MSTVRTLPDCLQDLFGPQADQLARDTRFIVRQRELSGRDFLTTLVFGYLHHSTITLQHLATQLHVTEAALQQRCAQPEAADFLAAVLRTALNEAIQRQPHYRSYVVTTPPALRAFTGVYVTDTTSLPLPACLSDLFPGCGHTPEQPTATLKILVTYELTTGRLHALHLYAGRASDNGLPWKHDLPAGSLHLTDLGFYRQERLCWEHEQGRFWISRLSCNHTLRDAEADASAITNLVAFLQAHAAASTLDRPVLVGSADHDSPLAARLVAWRVSDADCRRRQEQVRRRLSRKGQRVTPDVLALCGWLVFITNLTDTQLTAKQVGELYRLRWQIELLFKRWKSVLRLATTSRKRTVQTALVEVYSRLLGAVISSGWESHSGGPLRSSLMGVLHVWQRWSQLLCAGLRGLGVVASVTAVLAMLQHELRRLPPPRRRSANRVYSRLRLNFTVNLA